MIRRFVSHGLFISLKKIHIQKRGDDVLSEQDIFSLVSKNIYCIEDIKYDSTLTREEKLEKQIEYLTTCIKKQLSFDETIDKKLKEIARIILEKEENE